MSQENMFPKFYEAKINGRLFGTPDLKPIFNMKESLSRQLVMSKILKPDEPGSGPGTTNKFNVLSLPKIGFQNHLFSIGTSRKEGLNIVQTISPITWQEIADGEIRYLGLWFDPDGQFITCSTWLDLENEDFNFNSDATSLIMVDTFKIMQSIEDKL